MPGRFPPSTANLAAGGKGEVDRESPDGSGRGGLVGHGPIATLPAEIARLTGMRRAPATRAADALAVLDAEDRGVVGTEGVLAVVDQELARLPVERHPAMTGFKVSGLDRAPVCPDNAGERPAVHDACQEPNRVSFSLDALAGRCIHRVGGASFAPAPTLALFTPLDLMDDAEAADGGRRPRRPARRERTSCLARTVPSVACRSTGTAREYSAVPY